RPPYLLAARLRRGMGPRGSRSPNPPSPWQTRSARWANLPIYKEEADMSPLSALQVLLGLTFMSVGAGLYSGPAGLPGLRCRTCSRWHGPGGRVDEHPRPTASIKSTPPGAVASPSGAIGP